MKKGGGLSLPAKIRIISGIIVLIVLSYFLYFSIINSTKNNPNSNSGNLQNSINNPSNGELNNGTNIVTSSGINNCVPIDNPCNLKRCGMVDNGCKSVSCGSCNNADACINGVCVSNPTKSCVGTARGDLDFANKGRTTYWGSSYMDYCAPDNIGVYKSSCNPDGTMMGGYYNCKAYGYDNCYDGACINGSVSISQNNVPEKGISLLIFISPQYSNDNSIINAVNQYQDSLKKEGFNSKIIKLTNSENTIGRIRNIILTEVKNDSSMKAGLFIGEDIVSFVIRSSAVIESPIYDPWEILDEPINYINASSDFLIPSNGVLPSSSVFQPSDDPSIFDDMYARADRIWFTADNNGVLPNPSFFVSFLMPPENNQTFNQKRDKIIFALNKFTQYHNNPIDYGNIIPYEVYNFSLDSAPGDTAINALFSFNILGNLTGQIGGHNQKCLFDYNTNYKAFLAWGHADPHFVWTTCDVYSENISNLKTPFAILSGCNTWGWYTNESFGGRKTNVYDVYSMPPIFQPIQDKLFLESIFDSNNLIALETGTMQPGYQNYINNFTYSLESGKTLAEAHLSGGAYGTLSFYGDPFFHYKITS